jgi:hypothetical protein
MALGEVWGVSRRVSSFVSFAFMSWTYSPLDNKGGLKSHQKENLTMLLGEMVSEDSGYWDYALLMFYDEMLNSVVLSGLTALTDFG